MIYHLSVKYCTVQFLFDDVFFFISWLSLRWSHLPSEQPQVDLHRSAGPTQRIRRRRPTEVAGGNAVAGGRSQSVQQRAQTVSQRHEGRHQGKTWRSRYESKVNTKVWQDSVMRSLCVFILVQSVLGLHLFPSNISLSMSSDLIMWPTYASFPSLLCNYREQCKAESKERKSHEYTSKFNLMMTMILYICHFQ